VPLAPTLGELVAVCLIAPNLENVLQLLVRERMQVWPYLVRSSKICHHQQIDEGILYKPCWRSHVETAPR